MSEDYSFDPADNTEDAVAVALRKAREAFFDAMAGAGWDPSYFDVELRGFHLDSEFQPGVKPVQHIEPQFTAETYNSNSAEDDS